MPDRVREIPGCRRARRLPRHCLPCGAEVRTDAGCPDPARWEGHPVRFRPCRGQVRAALRAPSHHRVVRQPGLDHAAAWVVHRQCACMNRAARDRRQTPRQRIPAFPVPGPHLPVAMRAPPADIRGEPAWRQDSPPRQGRQPGEVVPRRRFAEEGARACQCITRSLLARRLSMTTEPERMHPVRTVGGSHVDPGMWTCGGSDRAIARSPFTVGHARRGDEADAEGA